MTSKHYDAGYLNNTGELLRRVKEYSYTPFLTVESGTIVDLGCGTGMDVLNLSTLVKPSIQLVGIDHDMTLIDRAKASLGERENVRFESGEVYKLPFQDQSIQGIRMERVVQHLKEPDQAFTEIYRVLAHDHPFVVVETVWNSLQFYTHLVTIEDKIRRYLVQTKVNNGLAANRLSHMLIIAGFAHVHMEVFCMVVHSLQEANIYVLLGQILNEMRDKELLTRAEYKEFTQALADADAQNCFTCSMNLVVSRATK